MERAPNEISVLDVVNAVDPVRRIESCPLELAHHDEELCPLHRRLNAAIALVEESFGATRISELLQDPERAHARCEPGGRRQDGRRRSTDTR